MAKGSTTASCAFSNDFAFSAHELLKSACDMALEGIIGKRRDSGYTSGRSSAWIKLKCRRRQEFVIGGYSEPSGSRAAFGALVARRATTARANCTTPDASARASTLRCCTAIKKELDAHETSRACRSLVRAA
jgi:bifunctional non-homologous end joining protein LigD